MGYGRGAERESGPHSSLIRSSANTGSGRNRVKLLGGGDPYPGADTGFPERGGGGGGGGEDIHKHPPLGHCPRDVIRPPTNWKTPPLLDIHKHPPLDIARVMSSTFQGGGGGDRSWSGILCIGFQYRDKFKGGGDHPCRPRLLLSETKKLGETKAERTTYHHNALLTSVLL